MSDCSKFYMKLLAHVGGLVRVEAADGFEYRFNGMIGLLLEVIPTASPKSQSREVALFIGGNVQTLRLFPDEIELIGGEDEFR